ncbi:IMPACT family protein [Pseudoduganella sp. HUAS MS19]
MPQTIISLATSDLIVKKSRFLGFVHPVADRAEAQAIVARLRAAHPDAAHVCWALLAGGQSAAVDDGEPGGTAGRPMLDVLRHQDLEGVLAAVVRYYGGIKLGAGGLVRAYTDAVAQALLKVEKVAIVRYTELRCTLPYALEGTLRRALAAAGAPLLEVSHEQRVTLAFRIAESAAPALVAELNEAASGQLEWPPQFPA